MTKDAACYSNGIVWMSQVTLTNKPMKLLPQY